MKTISMNQALNGDWFITRIETDDKRYSVTKLLGGKEIVHRSRHFSTKGSGGWKTDWWIENKNLQKAVATAESYGYKINI